MKKIFTIFLLLIVIQTGVIAKTDTASPSAPDQIESTGYKGTLPDILDKYQTVKPATGTPIFEAEEGFDDPDKLKPVPRDNPAFVDIILKGDKTSSYVNDINRIIPQVESLIDCIENGEDVQRFVAKATTLDFSIGALRKRYEGKPESYFISYTKLMEIGLRAKSLAELRKEGAEYNRYLAYQSSGAIYAPDNINRELQYFLEELIKVLSVLREVD